MKRFLLFLAALAIVPMGLTAQQTFKVSKTKKPGIIAHRGFHRREAIQHFSDLGFLDQAFFWNFA